MKILISFIALCGAVLMATSCAEFRERGPEKVEKTLEWWDYMDLGAHQVRQQRFDLAETYYLHALKTTGGDRSGICAPLSGVYDFQGRYCEAIEMCNRALQADNKFAQERLDKYYSWHARFERAVNFVGWFVPIYIPPSGEALPDGASNYYCWIGGYYLEQGNYDEALRNYERSITKAKEYDMRDGRNDETFDELRTASALGNYYAIIGEYKKSIKCYTDNLRLKQDQGELGFDIAQGKNLLAMPYYYSGNLDQAEKLFKEAAQYAWPAELAISLRMLGRIYALRGRGDNALSVWHKALEELSKEKRVIVYKVEQADIWLEIGCFYVRHGHSKEAQAALEESFRLRRETATATHPNCADAHKGLADVAAYKNELTSATLEATRALAILDKSVVPTHPRCAAELVALASIDILTGKPNAAAPLNARLETILQKPLGPWKEDFLDTAKFYAILLRKASKQADSTRLDQIYERQKDRR